MLCFLAKSAYWAWSQLFLGFNDFDLTFILRPCFIGIALDLFFGLKPFLTMRVWLAGKLGMGNTSFFPNQQVLGM